jgi:hypothetical protein
MITFTLRHYQAQTTAAAHTMASMLLLQALLVAAVLSTTVRGQVDVRSTDKIVVIAATASSSSSPLMLPDLLLHAVHVTECAAKGAAEHDTIVHTHMMRHEMALDVGRRAETATDTVGPQSGCVSYQRSSTTKRHIRVFSNMQAVACLATNSRLLSAASCSFGDASQRTLSSMATVSLVRSLSVCSVTLVLTSSSGAVDMLALTEVPPPISVDGTRGFTLFLLLSNSGVTYADHNVSL